MFPTPSHRCTVTLQEGEAGDGNCDLCMLCNQGGSLLCCDCCPAAYHMRCISETSKSLPEGEWLCPECAVGGRGRLPSTLFTLMFRPFQMFLCDG